MFQSHGVSLFVPFFMNLMIYVNCTQTEANSSRVNTLLPLKMVV